MATITESELLALVRRESQSAESYITSEITIERENGMERYLGEEYGDEEPGKSTVISRDTFEQVEWAMPSLLRIFASGDDVVDYSPEGPEDEEFADQATDMANHVFYVDNKGFLILNTWLKDGLLQKQGVVKSYWNEEDKTVGEQYTGLTDEEYYEIVSGEDVKVDEHTAYNVPGFELMEPSEDVDYGEVPDAIEDGEDQEVYVDLPQFHDVKLTRTISKNRIKIDPVPPEEFYMTYSSADPDDADYLEHRTRKTATQLIEEGFSKKVVESLPGDDTNDPTGERQTRMGNNQREYEEHADKAMRELTVHDSYVYVDANKDGVAEWWQVVWVGDTILEKTQIDSQPFSIWSPIPVPHRAYGLSYADVTMDLERIKTVLMRQTLDNLYLSNNPEREVDINKIVSMDDFMMSRPGGIKRVEEIGASREISHPFVAQHSFAMLDGIDGIISKRTGVNDKVAGVDANALSNESATANANANAAANQRIEMTARIFAETGLTHLFRRILHLLVTNQDQTRTIKLRNEWVKMDASKWNADMNVNIDVGLGHGNRDGQITHLNNILMWQKEMLASGGMGMVTPKHVYNTMERMIKTVGFKSVDTFFTDPGDGEMQQQQQGPDPQQVLVEGQKQIEQMKAQAKIAEAKLKIDADMAKAQFAHEHEMHKLAVEQEKIAVDREKIAADMRQTAAKIDADTQKASAQLQLQAAKEMKAAEEKDKDRMISAHEKNADRMTAMAAAQAPKNVSVSRDEDGNIMGTVNGG